MVSKNIELFGFKLPPGEFTIIMGDESLDIFNKFLDGRFLWAVSGIDWTKSDYVESYKVNGGLRIIECLVNFMKTYKLNGRYSLWFDDAYPILISGGLKHLCDMVAFFDEHPFMSCTDFWIFSEDTGECIEISHEDTVTLGISKRTS
ncbi:hypothetical protein HJB56_08570 [Rhizobium lentis]|uniref:hypothetical protein n=1 Tax=Rhizobium lentis TaxID=1138194 RepID=UPI001C8402A2|nr:hypothetical protein [Rhizobium lentis]MBX5082812.1 hypothetical protein [Rhizobium lentis]MBX5096047.1 hypothetical protein [Rhizobium lentis]MBX5120105.1 hypothetical protein [Rhizobium lentis]